MKNQKILKLICCIAILAMIINQLGSFPTVFAETKSVNQSIIYHDHHEYLTALGKYDKENTQYEINLKEYSQKKQEYGDAKAAADKITAENTAKKAAYEKEAADYQTKVDEYNQQVADIADHGSKGQYVGPEFNSMSGQLQSYLVNYAAMNQMISSGLSLTGNSLITSIQQNVATNPFTSSATVEENVQKLINEWNTFAAFEKSIGSEKAFDLSMSTVTTDVANGNWYNGFQGVEFYHTFSSSTGQTLDDVPSILNHPTEQNIKQALKDLFVKAYNNDFDSASMNMTKGVFRINPGMVTKWEAALDEAKTQAFTLYEQSINEYIDAFKVYNNSSYTLNDYDIFMHSIEDAADTQKRAFAFISGGGVQGVTPEDVNNNAPFFTSLRDLPVSELAQKYGYQLLLSNMASKATYGYFNLLDPGPYEVLTITTTSSMSNSFSTFKQSETNYTPTPKYPTTPILPTYEPVPDVLYEPVVPAMPIKPRYEPLNKITLLKVAMDNNKPLANAVFKLVNNDTKIELGNFTSNKNGIIEINNIDPGNYTLTETIAPKGYVLDNTAILFTIKGTENEKIQLIKTNKLVKSDSPITITNQKPEIHSRGNEDTHVTTTPTAAINSHLAQSGKETLPKTGDSNSFTATMIGIGLISSVFGLFYLGRRKELN
ncbi:SpaA isopeptide-forming pilin-related protein [Listeria ivanovii]|uniref:SpaA isopeptide-forming pilin-related protein n=1 Tax=Listeria ivanovii TaxID=1638 RepID=UPI00069F3C41|nr:SpaA isopeptide-forming pilin-related protein [Listeria ivanovii]MBK3914792.1 LPXTG cell wall anchor domain-containing protein [Listeria ivanovii subsp. ivanovii]MBK3922048.1 LPXTG cell wall anchor domain-containing protein [Listeria ivanovii subsp. ivanovii]MBK3927081.1 LPXTG cell wall anchor domain-containing protein [Listeria ivanovii subsp. ivanovii]